MNLVIIVGAQAVGKMTVGDELTKITNLKLFHNHMSIELGLKLAPWGTPIFKDVNKGIRELVMDSFIKHEKDLIFTFTWAFDLESDWAYMEEIREKFKDYKIHYVELVSDLNERLVRNSTEKRLQEKPSKRNTEWSKNELLKTMENHRLISNLNEVKYENYIKIDNTSISPQEVAKIIQEAFQL